MGLSESRKKRKISHDPNNTKWTRSTTTFGHRILSSQGWAPGQTLGPEKALHARHFTIASTSHVRIALRKENLGLGAKTGSGQEAGECTGLDSFQDLLGRLNGKTEVVLAKERGGRADVKRLLYAESKYGGWSKFVSAGYLEGSESMLNQLDTSTTPSSDNKVKGSDGAVSVEPRIVPHGQTSMKKSPERGNAKEEDVPSTAVQVAQHDRLTKVRRSAERAQRRAEKAERKEQRRKIRAADADKSMEVSKTSDENGAGGATPIVVVDTSLVKQDAPISSFAGGRHAIRSRQILQKKAAILDAKALNEILMVKS